MVNEDINAKKEFNALIKKSKESFEEDEKKAKPLLVLIQKTFSDLFTTKRVLISLAAMWVLPIIFLLFEPTVDYGTLSTSHASTAIAITLIFPMFLWTIGMVYTILIAASGSSMIADEVNSGTMLMLVSKPIKRSRIFLGKYLALYLYGAILSFIAIYAFGWIAVLRYSQNLDHYIGMLTFLTALYVYSLTVLFVFVSITLALSSIFTKARNAGVVVLLIVIFSFIGMSFMRMFISEAYQTYYIFHFDLGYHLANMFVFFIELFDAVPPVSAWQTFFGMMTGVYSMSSSTDQDQGINLGGLERADYYLPVYSLLVWIGIAVGLLIYGLISLQKREISG